MTEPIKVLPGTALASLIGVADAAFERGDVRGIDIAYSRAVDLAESDELRSALAVDHIARLTARDGATRALRRCDEYLATAAADEFALRLLRAEALGAIGDHEVAATEAALARVILAPRPGSLSPHDNARLLRVEGMAEANRGDLIRAKRLLADARRSFLAVSAQALADVIDKDLSLLAVRAGDRKAVEKALASPELKAPADYLRYAIALKRDLRYEEAYRVLLRAAAIADLDPALRVQMLSQLVVLAWLTCQRESAERLTEMLRDAAAESGDPWVEETLATLSPGEWPGPVTSSRFSQSVQDARRLIDTGRLDDAERLLVSLRPQEAARDEALRHLAAGELRLAQHRISGTPSAITTAIRHLGQAADLAVDPTLTDVRITALRRLGRAYARRAEGSSADSSRADGGRADSSRAAWCWGEAHRLEEHIAARQLTDDVRIGMLLAAPDEHDERIRAASEAEAACGFKAAAGVVVAMEAARGATILSAILPGSADVLRYLPELGNHDGAWRWLRGVTRSLPRSQVAWLLHATPDHVHHAIIGRGLLHHLCVPLPDAKLLDSALDDLINCQDPDYLEATVASGEFDQALAEIAGLIAVRDVVPLIPSDIRRVAIIAGGALAEIPFAALPVPGTKARLVHRYAFSDLPCLSARSPLHQRSLRQRGDRALLVSPPGSGLTASGVRAQATLDGQAATPEQLRAMVGSRRHRRVRIDCHGRYDQRNPARSWLQLAPDGTSGQLRPAGFQAMDLRGCGTLLLGACESGMAHRRGRQERAGFVRAVIQAGAGAVVAARWVADDAVAAAVLDRFERYLRYLPRDVALQRAQLDVCEGRAGLPGDPPYHDHPARWACWTLYGDSGWQAGALGRLLGRHLDERKTT